MYSVHLCNTIVYSTNEIHRTRPVLFCRDEKVMQLAKVMLFSTHIYKSAAFLRSSP